MYIDLLKRAIDGGGVVSVSSGVLDWTQPRDKQFPEFAEILERALRAFRIKSMSSSFQCFDVMSLPMGMAIIAAEMQNLTRGERLMLPDESEIIGVFLVLRQGISNPSGLLQDELAGFTIRPPDGRKRHWGVPGPATINVRPKKGARTADEVGGVQLSLSVIRGRNDLRIAEEARLTDHGHFPPVKDAKPRTPRLSAGDRDLPRRVVDLDNFSIGATRLG